MMTERVDNLQLTATSIREVVQLLVNALDPELIYMFGSRARGDFKETSDFDLMIIVADDSPPDARLTAREAVSGRDIYHDMKVWKRTLFERQLHLKASMPSTVLREGRLLYRKKGVNEPPTQTLHPATQRVCETEEPPYDPVRVENSREWLEKAMADFRSVQWNIEQCLTAHFGLALFHCQQTVEKAMKAFLVWHDHPATRHHDLEALAANCAEADPSLEPVLRSVGWLTVWSILGRYPNEAPPPTEELAQTGQEVARRAYDAIVERLPRDLTRDLGIP